MFRLLLFLIALFPGFSEGSTPGLKTGNFSAAAAPGDSTVIDLTKLNDPTIDLTGKTRVFLQGTYEGKAIKLRNGRNCTIKPLGTVHIYTKDQDALILYDCVNVTLDGRNGDRNEIRLIGGGLFTWGNGSHLTIRGIEVINSRGAGIKVKNDLYGRSSKAFRNVTIEYCRIINAAYEGMYLGFFSYYRRTGYAEAYAHPIRGLKVLNNEVYDCGWDGIQVGCADSATVVRGNIVRNNGRANVYGQIFSLSINSGFAGVITNNTCEGPIQIMPYSHTVFKNNTVTVPSDYAIFIRTEPNYGTYPHTDPKMTFRIEQNTINCPAGDAVFLLANNSTGTPVPVHRLVYTNNRLNISGKELRYDGNTSNYVINNSPVSKNLQPGGTVARTVVRKGMP